MNTPYFFLFVSHVSEDRFVANEVVQELERRGVPCWIAPRDISPGIPFDNAIADAIETCRAMLLIFSDRCNDSEYIRREVTVAGDAGKVIIPFRIEDAKPKSGLRVRLSDLHWIDAFASRERAIDELLRALDTSQTQLLSMRSVASQFHRDVDSPSSNPQTQSAKGRDQFNKAEDGHRTQPFDLQWNAGSQTNSPFSKRFRTLALLGLLLVAVAGIGILFIQGVGRGVSSHDTAPPILLPSEQSTEPSGSPAKTTTREDKIAPPSSESATAKDHTSPNLQDNTTAARPATRSEPHTSQTDTAAAPAANPAVQGGTVRCLLPDNSIINTTSRSQCRNMVGLIVNQ
jgi:hypothetical protein